MFSRILVGLDGSGISKTAFSRAMEIAKETHAELHAITVITRKNDENLQTKSEDEAKELHKEIEILARENDLSIISHITSSGNPGENIIETAEIIGADLIVVGSLGKTQVERILLGSVSSYVTKNAKTNIVVIRY